MLRRPLTPSLSPLRGARAIARPSAPAIPLGRGIRRPLLPAGEKVPEGRMRGSPLPLPPRAKANGEALELLPLGTGDVQDRLDVNMFPLAGPGGEGVDVAAALDRGRLRPDDGRGPQALGQLGDVPSVPSTPYA